MTHRKKVLKLFIFALIGVSFTSCNKEAKKKSVRSESISFKENRWFTEQQFEVGKQVFATNCAACHGNLGQGIVENWKRPDDAGNFPAPPLNGTAHTWHHPKFVLLETIDNGGIPLGGTMPAFKGILTDEEKEAVIAYIQSMWDDETYVKWLKMDNMD